MVSYDNILVYMTKSISWKSILFVFWLNCKHLCIFNIGCKITTWCKNYYDIVNCIDTLCIWSWWCENRISMIWVGERRQNGRCEIKHFRFAKASFNILPLNFDIMQDQIIKIIEDITIHLKKPKSLFDFMNIDIQLMDWDFIVCFEII